MKNYSKEFIDLSLQRNILRFGEFTLKSGRVSPYFFNAGLFNDGASLARLGSYYAAMIFEQQIEFDTLFGPAYKGITLAAATAIALAEKHNINKPYCYNRKEKKDHGEGGTIVGAELSGRVLIIDDVISAGTSVNESVELIKENNAELAGVIVALDRQETGKGELSAVQEIEQQHNTKVNAIASLDMLITYIKSDKNIADNDLLKKIIAYKKEYGV